MPMHDLERAKEIAASLERNIKSALLRAEPDGQLGLLFVRYWQANGPVIRALVKRGLGTPVWSGAALSETGLAVRRILEQKEAEHV